MHINMHVIRLDLYATNARSYASINHRGKRGKKAQQIDPLAPWPIVNVA